MQAFSFQALDDLFDRLRPVFGTYQQCGRRVDDDQVLDADSGHQSLFGGVDVGAGGVEQQGGAVAVNQIVVLVLAE